MVGALVGDVGRPDRPLDASTARRGSCSATRRPRGAPSRTSTSTSGPGEVVALYGKLGSGTGEVAEAAFGIRPLASGRRPSTGKPAPAHPRVAVARASASCPPTARTTAPSWRAGGREPRRAVLAAPGRRPVWLKGRREARRSGDGTTRSASARASGATAAGHAVRRQPAEGAARPLAGAPLALLLLIEPTRGVDVGARQEIYASVRQLAADGVAVLVATSDYEEVVQLADRAVVMARGRIVAELDSTRHDADAERLAGG